MGETAEQCSSGVTELVSPVQRLVVVLPASEQALEVLEGLRDMRLRVQPDVIPQTLGQPVGAPEVGDLGGPLGPGEEETPKSQRSVHCSPRMQGGVPSVRSEESPRAQESPQGPESVHPSPRPQRQAARRAQQHWQLAPRRGRQIRRLIGAHSLSGTTQGSAL